ncbi:MULTISPECIES: hypothetical protein [Psychromonas]|uniref:hypothetical protein n=1 Tax=Psychromonas TaxID=67572 RepID=UPI0004044C59|nr:MULTISPECIES: hypothetical protein [Psychromonas]MBB1274564.1 S-adenosylmethionine decarboxylase [Psychromonas sp. SR45-3]
MFYEGTEKRLVINTKGLNLFDFEDEFWIKLVAHCGAEVLSSIRNSQVKAYLLSESSLFVWKNKLILITCGNTQLVKAALFIQQQFTKQHISTLIFQRHQALKPQLQRSNFKQDTLLLEKQFNGQNMHWRDGYQGDLFVFGEVSSGSIITQSIYMLHGLNSELAKTLQTNPLDKQTILAALKIRLLFEPPFKEDPLRENLLIDHYSFSPKGYSLNAICGEDYITLHLTPEKMSTYLSIETSFAKERCIDLINHLQQLFLPNETKSMHFNSLAQQLTISIV